MVCGGLVGAVKWEECPHAHMTLSRHCLLKSLSAVKGFVMRDKCRYCHYKAICIMLYCRQERRDVTSTSWKRVDDV